jgi:hypothetical protein
MTASNTIIRPILSLEEILKIRNVQTEIGQIIKELKKSKVTLFSTKLNSEKGNRSRCHSMYLDQFDL